MMDCPRCGFSQPKDRYCANCGLDVDSFLAKPKPIWVRILQNPNLHLTLILTLLVMAIGYILYTRTALVSREVRQMFGTPLTSREAGDRNRSGSESASDTAQRDSEAQIPSSAAQDEGPEAGMGNPTAVTAAAPATVASVTEREVKRLEVSFHEVARDTLAGLLTNAERTGEGSAGRVYLLKESGRVPDALRAGSRRVGQPRTAPLQAGARVIVVTPPTAPEPFQFGFDVQVVRWENRECHLRWDGQVVLSQPETPAEMASQAPAVRAVTESNLFGNASLGPAGAILVVWEPGNRRPRDEYLARAGEGPWSIFASDDFRNDITDWVALIQLK